MYETVSIEIDERGKLEIRTLLMNSVGFKELRDMLFQTKRVVISTAYRGHETSLCFTIDDSYEPPKIKG